MSSEEVLIMAKVRLCGFKIGFFSKKKTTIKLRTTEGVEKFKVSSSSVTGNYVRLRVVSRGANHLTCQIPQGKLVCFPVSQVQVEEG